MTDTDCQYCSPGATTPTYHQGERIVVWECDTCGEPVLAPAVHAATPADAGEEAYALGVARGLFGPAAAFFEASHPTPAGHWHRHIAVPTE